MENIKYMVRVSCMTFNHAHYIEDAMNGFCMQETNFPFVCTIIDDCSTDGEQDVIKNYLEAHFDLEDSSVVRNEETDDYFLTFAQHKTNKNCYFAVLFLKYNHHSIKKPKKPYIEEWSDTKYVAMCEGDDYWIDTNKLQKQILFMEEHHDHTLCVHAYRRDGYEGEKIINSTEVHLFQDNVETVPDEVVLKGTGMFAATATMLYRNDARREYPDWARHTPIGDRPLQLVLFSRGNIGYLNEVMSVYRIGVPGSWTIRTKKRNKERRRRFIQMYKDFDEWTEGKYHFLITKGLFDFKKTVIKNTIIQFLYKPYSYIKKIINT